MKYLVRICTLFEQKFHFRTQAARLHAHSITYLFIATTLEHWRHRRQHHGRITRRHCDPKTTNQDSRTGYRVYQCGKSLRTCAWLSIPFCRLDSTASFLFLSIGDGFSFLWILLQSSFSWLTCRLCIELLIVFYTQDQLHSVTLDYNASRPEPGCQSSAPDVFPLDSTVQWLQFLARLIKWCWPYLADFKAVVQPSKAVVRPSMTRVCYVFVSSNGHDRLDWNF